ncbi:MAG: hypothetical protein PIR02_12490 [Microbacterium enclense]
MRIDVLERVTATVFGTAGDSRSDVDFPCLIKIDATGGPTTLTVSWDGRIWTASDRAVIEDRNGQLSVLTASNSTASSVTFTIPAETVRLAPQARVAAIYPSDTFDDPVATRIEFGTVETTLEVRAVSVQAWGAELVVAWTLLDSQYVPSIVQLRNVGPGSVPEGVEVEYSLTPSGADLVEATPDITSDAKQGVGASERRSCRFGVPSSTPVGDVYEVSFALADVDSTRPSLTQSPTVTVVIPDNGLPGCRATGLYSSAPVSSSGTALSDFSEPETA